MSLSTAQLAAPARPHSLVRRRTMLITFPILTISVLSVAIAPAHYAALVAPIAATVSIATVFVATLWNRDRLPPVFEVGTFWMAAVVLYATVPLLNFMVMRLNWNEWTDARLLAYSFDVQEIAAFAWRYVVYLGSFAAVYLLVRGRTAVLNSRPAPPSSPLAWAICLMFAGTYVFQQILYLLYGAGSEVSYLDAPAQGSAEAAMPYWLTQINHNVASAVLLLKLLLVMLLLQNWSSRRWRVLLFSWLTVELAYTALRGGSRTSAMLLVIGAVVLFYRLVRRLGVRFLLSGALILLTAFMIDGVVRARSNDGVGLTSINIMRRTNEFQALFATGFDIYKRQELGELPPVPWQIHFTDFYILIPSQILPFAKIDPSQWYLDVIGARHTGVGFMFGAISQALVGFDWVELAVRGGLLGMLFALLHRWYVRHASSFWATIFYVYVAIWSYYTFRATSFWISYFIVYQFVPVMLLAKLLESAFGRMNRITNRRYLGGAMLS